MSIPFIPGVTYQWQFSTAAGGPFTPISGATANSYTMTQSGYYQVVVSVNSCVATSAVFNGIITAINPIPGNNPGEFHVFPNPVQQGNSVVIDKVPASVLQVQISLYSTSGQQVYHKSVPVTSGMTVFTLPDAMGPGLYLLRMQGKRSSRVFNVARILLIQ